MGKEASSKWMLYSVLNNILIALIVRGIVAVQFPPEWQQPEQPSEWNIPAISLIADATWFSNYHPARLTSALDSRIVFVNTLPSCWEQRACISCVFWFCDGQDDDGQLDQMKMPVF